MVRKTVGDEEKGLGEGRGGGRPGNGKRGDEGRAD